MIRMKVLVTGASGRIGANIVARLLKEGMSVIAAVRPRSKRIGKLGALQGDIQVVECDLTDRAGLAALSAGADAIVHNGAHLGPGGPLMQFDVTLGSTVTLLEAVRDRTDLKRFVQISSSIVYEGPTVRDEPQTEDEADYRITSGPYGAAKISTESWCCMFHARFGVPTTALRFPYVICGKEILEPSPEASIFGLQGQIGRMEGRADARSFVSEAKSAIDAGARLIAPLNEDGTTHLRHWCDVRDAVEGVWLALTKDEATGEAFNIMSHPIDFGEAAETLSSLTGLPAARLKHPDQYRYRFSLEKAGRLLGYSPRYDGRMIVTDAYRHWNGQDIGVIAT